MKIFKHKKHNIGKKYVKSASAFKKLAERSGSMNRLDFSIEAMKEHYYYGTYGGERYRQKYDKERPDRQTNAYAYGEFLYNLTLTMIEEDLADGHVCKAEFIFDYSIPGMLRKEIKDINIELVKPLFGNLPLIGRGQW